MENFLGYFIRQATAYRMCENCQRKAIRSITAMSRQAEAAKEAEATRDRGDRASARLRELTAQTESTVDLALCCTVCRRKADLIARTWAEKST